jgi:hypothetical protein
MLSRCFWNLTKMCGARMCLNWKAKVPQRGATLEEALKNIQDVAQMVIEELLEDSEPLPASITVSDRLLVAVTV